MTVAADSRLEFRDVRKSYGAKAVLQGFTATFAPGRIAALVGPNGAGKTTLLRIAAGLQSADEGSVTSGPVLYYGGFDTLPIKGTIDQLRASLRLPPVPNGAARLATLSRGELQRVGLAIALEVAPAVLLLDEPWAALEPDARESLNQDLQRLATGRVVICSTHDLDEVARVADDVVVLSAGTAIWKRREDGMDRREEVLRLYQIQKRA